MHGVSYLKLLELNSGCSGIERLWNHQVYIGEIGVDKVRNELLHSNSISAVAYDISLPWDLACERLVVSCWSSEWDHFDWHSLSADDRDKAVGVIYLRNKTWRKVWKYVSWIFLSQSSQSRTPEPTHIHINTLRSDDGPKILSYKVRRKVAGTQIWGKFWSSLLLASSDLDGMRR